MCFKLLLLESVSTNFQIYRLLQCFSLLPLGWCFSTKAGMACSERKEWLYHSLGGSDPLLLAQECHFVCLIRELVTFYLFKCVGVGPHMPQYMWKSKDTLWEAIDPSALWVPRVDLRCQACQIVPSVTEPSCQLSLFMRKGFAGWPM